MGARAERNQFKLSLAIRLPIHLLDSPFITFGNYTWTEQAIKRKQDSWNFRKLIADLQNYPFQHHQFTIQTQQTTRTSTNKGILQHRQHEIVEFQTKQNNHRCIRSALNKTPPTTHPITTHQKITQFSKTTSYPVIRPIQTRKSEIKNSQKLKRQEISFHLS